VAEAWHCLPPCSARSVRRIVFSSSATIYGNADSNPIPETAPLRPANVYGRSKLMVEDILRDLHAAAPGWSIALLRYFNPVGAHPGGLIGEDPNDIPNNLMPFVTQVAVGRRPELQVFGGDYPTPDGTGVRDYIHVAGHAGVTTVNLGTGQGYSVLDVVRAFEQASGRSVPYETVARRPGDIAACYADPGLAASLLGWRAEFGIERMCADSWRWQSGNPEGYPAA
jgi:UDP-glucose 4-epimerase